MLFINKGKNWFDSLLKLLMGSKECPEFDVLVSYHRGDVASKIEHQIEEHLLNCELCSSVVQSLPLVGDVNRIDLEVELANSRIRDYNRAEGMAAPSLKKLEKKPARIRSRLGRLQPILSTPIFRYSLAAAVLTLIFYSVAVQYLTQPYYEVAALNSDERSMLLLFSDSKRGEVQSENEFYQGALWLLSAEQKRWGLIPSFDQQKVQQATLQLITAFETSTEPFYRNKYAYFLGKAYLMQSDVINARHWLDAVVNAPRSEAYHLAANRLLKRLP